MTQKGRPFSCWTRRTKPVGGRPREIRVVTDPERLWDVDSSDEADWFNPCCQEKPLVSSQATVPQTDTGRRGENPKALEKTLVKELGKLTP